MSWLTMTISASRIGATYGTVKRGYATKECRLPIRIGGARRPCRGRHVDQGSPETVG